MSRRTIARRTRALVTPATRAGESTTPVAVYTPGPARRPRQPWVAVCVVKPQYGQQPHRVALSVRASRRAKHLKRLRANTLYTRVTPVQGERP